jgi:hypothetical protein
MIRPNISAGYFRGGLPFNRFGEGSRVAEHDTVATSISERRP